MKPMPSMRMTRSANSASSSGLLGSCVVGKDNAFRKTFACCWAVNSWRRLQGPGLLSFTRRPPLESSRPPLQRQQQRRSDYTCDDTEKVDDRHVHESVQRVGVGKWTERTDVGVHDPVQHRMENPPEYAAEQRDRQPVLRDESLGDDVARSRYPCAQPRDD